MGFGIAEADVELEDFGAGGGEHQASVEEAGEGGSFDGHLVECGEHDAVHDLAGLGGGEEAGVEVSAHAAGVGAFVVVEDALVVLGGGEGQEGCAGAEADEADFFAFEEFFEEEMGAEAFDGVFGLGGGGGDDDAFAAGETVGFDDDGQGEAGEGGVGFLISGDLDGAGGGDGGAFEELFGEDFGAFEAGGGLGGADDVEIALAETVDDAGDQRGFGADDGEVDGEGFGEVGVTGDVSGRGEAAGELGDAGVAGAGDEIGDLGRLGQAPGEGMFAASAADDQDVQEWIPQ